MGGGEKNKKGECGWCTFYTNVNMEHANLLKSPWEEYKGRKENNAGDEPICDIWKCHNETPYITNIKKKQLFKKKERKVTFVLSHLVRWEGGGC
jgi:hypothetical protein